MSDAIGTIATLVGANARNDEPRPRDTRAPDPTQPSFATLLGAALAPAARPLTRPAAAETTGSVNERASDEGLATDATHDSATTGGATVAARGTTGAIMESGGGPATAAASTIDAAAAGVYRGTDALAPELQTRLGRVIERMREEHGHEVRVTETFRSQARQDHLHAQGRTAAGPVVTWTRQSNHTLGRAADVLVNGTYDDPKAYATLQRIAREEGLHTLGMRDLGHLELPKSVGGRVNVAELARLGEAPGLESLRIEQLIVGDDEMLAMPGRARGADAATAAAPARVASVAGVPTVAPVAQVAAVAQVAQVAGVAQVAIPGLRRAAPVTSANAPTRATTVAGDARRGATLESGGGPAARRAAPFAGTMSNASSATVAAGEARTAHAGTTHGRIASERGGRAEREASDGSGVVEGATSIGESAWGGATNARAEGGVATLDPASRAAHVATTDHLARLDRIAALRESAGQVPLSHLTLTLDDGAGGADRIRVGMRGTSVGATLELSDAARAEHMTARLGELQQALEARGLDPEGLHVRRTTPVAEPGEVARVATTVLEREALRSGASSSSQSQSQSQQQQQQSPQSQATTQREREERAARDGSRHEDPSSSRHRSRREHEEHTR